MPPYGMVPYQQYAGAPPPQAPYGYGGNAYTPTGAYPQAYSSNYAVPYPNPIPGPADYGQTGSMYGYPMHGTQTAPAQANNVEQSTTTNMQPPVPPNLAWSRNNARRQH